VETIRYQWEGIFLLLEREVIQKYTCRQQIRLC
jgi:hypothetical protein